MMLIVFFSFFFKAEECFYLAAVETEMRLIWNVCFKVNPLAPDFFF
jgi:hypothetical protein